MMMVTFLTTVYRVFMLPTHLSNVSVIEVIELSSFVTGFIIFGIAVLLTLKYLTSVMFINAEEPLDAIIRIQQPIKRRMHVETVHIPLRLELTETPADDKVRFTIISETSYSHYIFWGVSIRHVHCAIWEPWEESEVAIEKALHGHYIQRGWPTEELCEGDKTTLALDPVSHMDLGVRYRLRYPLVVFLTRKPEGEPTPNEVVALVYIIHVKDPVCPLRTSILAQYLKQANGQVSHLKKLYLAASSPTSEQLCIVCQTAPLSRAILPCRHTCLCGDCFLKLNACPICRSPIKSYFSIREDEAYNQNYDGLNGD